MITDLWKNDPSLRRLAEVFNSILTALVISQFIFHYFLGFLNVTPVKKEAMIKENLSFY